MVDSCLANECFLEGSCHVPKKGHCLLATSSSHALPKPGSKAALPLACPKQSWAW